jgi:hypothetical protein
MINRFREPRINNRIIITTATPDNFVIVIEQPEGYYKTTVTAMEDLYHEEYDAERELEEEFFNATQAVKAGKQFKF